MPLFCPNCAYVPEDSDEPYCHRCGHNFASEPEDAAGPLPAISRAVPARRHQVAVDRFRAGCPCYGEQLRYDPYSESMSSRFDCGRYPDRIDCVACPVCQKCGGLPCTCGFLGIEIKVKTPPTVETVALGGRLG